MFARSAAQLSSRLRAPAQSASFSTASPLFRYGARRVIIKAPTTRSATDARADGQAWKPPSERFYGSLFNDPSDKPRRPMPGQPSESETTPEQRSKEEEPAKPEEDTAAADAGPSKPLPDLRFGIPSEMPKGFGFPEGEKATASGKTKGEEGESDEARNEFPDSAYQTSTDRQFNKFARYSIAASALGTVLALLYFGRNWENEEQEKAHPDAPSGFSIGLFWARLRARLNSNVDYYTKPPFKKLLPDMEPSLRPPSGMTLVLSLEDLMVHNDWTRDQGWRTAKRPGLDYFLRYLSQYYELVLFTTAPMMSVEPILARLDPFRIITWPLFREATLLDGGDYVKDLSYLNRDLSKVIVLDTNPKHLKFQPENGIILEPWKGTPGDDQLVSLIPFLEYVAAMEVPDVRTVLKSFEGTDIPHEFARREAIKREAILKQLEAEKAAKNATKNGGFAWFASALGMKSNTTPTGEMTTTAGLAEGKMLSDLIRERGIRNYELLDKQIRESGEQWLKDIEAEQKRLQDEHMQSVKNSFFGSWFGSKKAEPKEDQKAETAEPVATEPAETEAPKESSASS